MRNADQRPGTVFHRLSLQPGDPVLRHHVIHIVTRRRHHLSFRQQRRDLRHQTPILLFRRGRHGDDRPPLSIRRHGRPADEVHLTSHSRKLTVSDGIRRHLPVEVHSDPAVDAHHIGVLRDHHGVVHIVHSPHLADGIPVAEIVQLPASHHKVEYELPPVNGLAAVVDHSRLVQVHHSVCQQLRVDPQMLLLLQLVAHRVRYGSDTKLQRISVPDQLRAVLSDRFLHRPDLRRRQRGQFPALFHKRVDLLHGKHPVPKGKGQLIVHLRDDQLR